jgi:hypothetical protein
MKTIPWTGNMPICDICPKPGPHDAPTIHGPWANLCDDCLPLHTTEAGRAIGTTKVHPDD